MALNYGVYVIRDNEDYICLTDMWKAAGSIPNREPYNWVRKEGSEFVAHVQQDTNLPAEQVLYAERGRGGGTWAHWQVGIAYAQYLSPEFHTWCNQVVRTHMEGRGQQVAGLSARDIAVVDAVAQRIVAPIVERMDANFLRTWQQQSDLDNRVTRIEEHLGYISARIPQRRREITAKTREEIAFDALSLGGRCPCCNMVDVVSADASVINNAEFDHYYSNQMPDAMHVWLICKTCHTELTAGRLPRTEADAHFRSFQSRRARLPGRGV